MASFRLALLPFLLAASCSFAAQARRDDPVSLAGDAAAFKRLRAEIAQRNAARGPQARRMSAPACKVYPVMTDAEIEACRRAPR